MSSRSQSPSGANEDRVAALETAQADLERARERIAEFGRDDLEALQDAYDEFTTLLARYEEPATGDGNFQTFIEFQGEVETFVERLPSDLLLRETFVECDEHLQQRRLTEDDFEHVRAQLEPVADLVGRLDEERSALSDYRSAYAGLQRRRRELRERIEDLERLQSLADADLDAPTARLREPVDRYNEAVTTAFETFRREAPARAVLALVERAEEYPLVEFRPAPEDLLAFLEGNDVGEEPISRLLEYAGFSRSKLEHYVDDPVALREHVASQQTYLERLDAEPLTVAWPPPAAEGLRYRTREYRAIVTRFAPDVVEPLRIVRRLPHDTDYERLRRSAVARTELTDQERERLRSGAVATELEEARTGLARVRETLSEYPDR